MAGEFCSLNFTVMLGKTSSICISMVVERLLLFSFFGGVFTHILLQYFLEIIALDF